MRFTLYIVLFVLLSNVAQGQFFDKDRWQDQRRQIAFGVGGSNFLGDLGGKDGIGTNDFKDLEIPLTKFSAYISYDYIIYKRWHLRADFLYGQVAGDDKLTAEPFRSNRNLHFKSNIFELDILAEFEIPINVKKGHLYNIKGAQGWKNGGSSIYLFAGVGGFYFNPKTYFDGQWIELQPLSTEGQGIPGGPKQYRRLALSIPVGLSFNKRVGHRMSVGIELRYHYTFTDYIDDVSTTYFDPNEISLYIGGDAGDLAGYLSNPSLGPAQGGLNGYVTSPGQQRGDATDDDGYMFGLIKVQYLLRDKYKRFQSGKKSRSNFKPKYSSGRKRKISF